MALSFPTSPTTGQTYPESGRTWQWTGSRWQSVQSAPAAHKSSHATGGTDALTPADIGAVANGGGASTISVMTEAAYTALPTKDTNTIYVLI
jgi:hypothetical protein